MRNLQGQQSSRDIIHIGNTVFKAADDKKADRQKCAQSTAGCAFCTQAAHYANADQYVAQNPQNHRSAKGKGTLRRRSPNGAHSQSPVRQVQLSAVHDHSRQQHRANQIADINPAQVSQHPGPGHPSLQNRNSNQAVPGKQLRPGKQHHDQSKGEQKSAHHPGHGQIFQGVARCIGHHGSHSNENSRQNRQQQDTPCRRPSLFISDLTIRIQKLRWGQHRILPPFHLIGLCCSAQAQCMACLTNHVQ